LLGFQDKSEEQAAEMREKEDLCLSLLQWNVPRGTVVIPNDWRIEFKSVPRETLSKIYRKICFQYTISL
jgi:hypothetical protein